MKQQSLIILANLCQAGHSISTSRRRHRPGRAASIFTHNWSTRSMINPKASPCRWKQTSVTTFQSNVSFISLFKPTQFFLTIFADRTTLLWFIDWVDTLGDCAVCYNTVNFIAGLAAAPFAWRGLGTNLRLARRLRTSQVCNIPISPQDKHLSAQCPLTEPFIMADTS